MTAPAHTPDEWRIETLRAYRRWCDASLDPLCPVIIGQAGAGRRHGERRGTAMFPNPRTSAGYRLFRMTGLTLDEYVCGFERFNTITRFPGQSGRGHKFPPGEARSCAAIHVVHRRLLERPCVIIGKANAEAYFTRDGLPDPLQWHRAPHSTEPWAWMPHTSGIVQFWNQPGNADRVAPLFADLSDYVPGDNS